VTTPHPGARDVTTARRRVGASIASTYVCWTWVGVAALAGAALEHPPGPDVPPPPRGVQWGFEALAVVSLAVALCHLVVVVALLAGRPRVQRAGTITAAIGGAVAAAYAAPATGSATLALGAVLGLVGEITLLYVLLPRSPAAARRQAPTVPPPGHPSSGEVPWEKGLDIVGAMATVVGSVTMALAGLGTGRFGVGMFLLDREVSADHGGGAASFVLSVPALLVASAFMTVATALVALGVAHLLGRPWPSSTGPAPNAAPVDAGPGAPSGPHGGIPERRPSVGTPAVPVDRGPNGPGVTTIVAAVAAAVAALVGSWVGLVGLVGPELGGTPTGPAGTVVSVPGVGAVVVALAVWHLALAVSLVLGAPWAPPAGIVTFTVTGALALLGALPGWSAGWLLTVADLTAAGLLSAGRQRELPGGDRP
jgi:hypothetical protein